MSKILLSTYLLKILDNDKNEQILSRFNGSDDFLRIFENYLNTIYQNIRAESDSSQTITLHLTLESPPTLDLTNRRIYGYFSSGVSGDEYQIRDLVTQDNLLDVEKNHAAFRNLFFYIQIPSGRNSGALILQRKSKYGIKTIFRRTINRFMQEQGYQIYKVHVNNLLHGRVYRRMIEYGKLKRVDLIKRTIPATIEEYFANDGNHNLIPGILKTSMLSGTSLPETYRSLVDRLFNDPDRERIEIDGIDEEFDEVEFELELNGKRKTFFVANRAKIQPDIDVTNQLEYDENGNPTTDSLLRQAEELVQDIIEINPTDVH
ncbi:MAG: hypothetical protein KKG99_16345 [Bacteroidetes bacterium]|nr:hypothetical protein [Bacteroidota bacterium]